MLEQFEHASILVLGSGTSVGVPMIGCRCKTCSSDDQRDKRLRPSVLLRLGNARVLIDTSPDFRYQALHFGIDRIDAILYTHAHADHLTAAAYLKQKLGCRLGTGEHVRTVQQAWREILNLDGSFRADGSQFDQLFTEGERLALGELTVTVWHTPGHTPGCVAYVVTGGDAPACVFVGDTMFMPDCGTARADFPGGDARRLYRSIRRILSLPPETRLFVCHDYPPAGRTAAFETTVAEQRRANIHVKDGTEEGAFAEFRNARDKTLGQPTLLLPSIQVNIRAGVLPPPEDNGVSYLKIPLNRF